MKAKGLPDKQGIKKTVLIIDDDKELCEETKEFLEGENCIVDIAPTSFEGKRLIRKNAYHIVLLDYRLSDSDGVSTLKEIKDIRPESKVYMITGRPNIEDLVKEENAMKLAEMIMQKPLGVDKLLSIIA